MRRKLDVLAMREMKMKGKVERVWFSVWKTVWCGWC